jgi:hypothetical protein
MLSLAANGNSPAHYAKGTQSPVMPPKEHHRAPTACRCMVSGSFYSPNRGSFHRSLALLYTIGRRGVLSLGGWAPQLHTEFHELRATLVRQHKVQVFAYRTITFCGRTFQTVQLTIPLRCRRPQPQGASPLVWAFPLSLAATYGVSVDFFSYRYLDVSVPCVRPIRSMHSTAGEGIWLPSPNGLPHSEIPGLTVARHLPRAYRSLPRPSSPLDA